MLRAYVQDYPKHEILAEGPTRNLPVCSTFLSAAALGDGSRISYATIARDCRVSARTAREYFQTLADPPSGALPARKNDGTKGLFKAKAK